MHAAITPNFLFGTNNSLCRLRRNTFPKVDDAGKAVMMLEDIGLEIVLSVSEDRRTQVPQVDEVDVRLHVQDFRIEVTEGTHLKLYNKVFGLVRFVVRKVRCITPQPASP